MWTHLCLIGWRNLWRNRRRSLLSALAVGFAVAVLCFVMALQQGSYASMIHNTARNATGHLQIQHEAYWPDLDLWRALIDPWPLVRQVEALPHVEGVAPRIQTAALVSHGERTFGAAVTGLDPEREARGFTLPARIRQGRFLAPSDAQAAVLGAALAANLGVVVGDEVALLGQGSDGSLAAARLTVVGLYETGMPELDRTSLAAPLPAIQEAFALPHAVTEIAILLRQDRHRAATVAAIEPALRAAGRTDARVLDWVTLIPGLEESMRLDWYMGLVFFFIMVLVVGFGIANTFLMAFLERRHEFGVLLALGMKPSRLAVMVYAESILLTLLGVAVGLAAGVPIVLYFQHEGISFGETGGEILTQYGMDPVVHPLLVPVVLLWSIGMVLAVSVLLAIYPAWKAARLRPVEAMRA